MDKLLDKLSSYNLFNYLIPGLVFGGIFVELDFFEFPTKNVFADLVAAYALGLLISRLGSLLVEPLFKYFKIIEFSDYPDYVYACDNDEKIEIFVEQTNSYRTFLAGFLLILASYPTVVLADHLNLSSNARSVSLLVAGLLICIWSYKKQSDYVSKRVNARTSGR